MTGAVALGIVAALAGATPRADAAARTPAPVRTASRPPLDFTGVWVLDEKESRNVSPAMKDAVLDVRQTGNRIWISPADASKSHLLAESLVADGRAYEKTLGLASKAKGWVTVDWARDGKALWLEVTAGPEANPRQVVQRSVWKLSDDRKTWVRQSVSIQEGKTQQSTLVFRRREAAAARTPAR